MVLARQYSESEDSILTGSFLPLISAILARNVFIAFGERMFPNLYSILVAKTGLRKTTIRAVGDPYRPKLASQRRHSSPASQAPKRSFLSI